MHHDHTPQTQCEEPETKTERESVQHEHRNQAKLEEPETQTKHESAQHGHKQDTERHKRLHRTHEEPRATELEQAAFGEAASEPEEPEDGARRGVVPKARPREPLPRRCLQRPTQGGSAAPMVTPCMLASQRIAKSAGLPAFLRDIAYQVAARQREWKGKLRGRGLPSTRHRKRWRCWLNSTGSCSLPT